MGHHGRSPGRGADAVRARAIRSGAKSYLEALNTGHEGSISTIHANNTYASFSRLASIVKQSAVGMTVDMDLIMKTIKTSIDVILFFNHTHLTEIYYEPEDKNKLLSQL